MAMLTTPDGVHLYYERHGDAGDPLLCIMGLGGTLDFWEFQTPVLARSHRVFIYDNRGAGRSDKPSGPYTIRTLAEDALAALDACGFGRAHVLGISMGGMIAQELAIRHPDRIGGLALAATYAKPDDRVRETRAALPFDPSTVDPKQLLKLMLGLTLTPEFIEREKPWLRTLRERVMGSWTMEGFLAQLAAVMSHDATAELHRITAPTLVLKPSNDRLIPPRCSDLLAEQIAGAQLVTFDHAAHGFNIEQPDKFNRAVLDFFAHHPLDEEARF
jgi:pimeloyl-ACP methyl ester carboxylesterase